MVPHPTGTATQRMVPNPVVGRDSTAPTLRRQPAGGSENARICSWRPVVWTSQTEGSGGQNNDRVDRDNVESRYRLQQGVARLRQLLRRTPSAQAPGDGEPAL